MKQAQENKHLKDITEIRSIMERSSSFLSLSGLSGVFAGTFALAGAGFAYYYIKVIARKKLLPSLEVDTTMLSVLILDAVIVLALALIFGSVMTRRNAANKGYKIWNSASKRMLANLMIPLITGGLTIFIFIKQGIYTPISGLTLIFYGLALVNASKYTLRDIRYLGLIEILLGLITLMLNAYALIIWAIGFGIMHIIYGTVMYYKYERVVSDGNNK